MLRQNLKNPRWWAVLVPGLLVGVVGVVAEWIGKGACRALDWMYDWAYDWGA